MINAVSSDDASAEALYSGTHDDFDIVAKVSPKQSADIVDNEEAHERLLLSRKVVTQSGLDVVLQYFKDTKLLSPTSGSLIVVVQQLVKETGGLPARFDLGDVTVSGLAKARGGSADIYQGYIQGKNVCIKKIRRTKDTLDKVSENISNEVILCGYLPAHPNILSLLGVYRERDIHSLVYPWMENGDLTLYLKRCPDSNRIQLLHDVSLGLQFLHERSIVHGDLKGTNILVDDSERACIADFGLSSILPSQGGTPYCQAPELLLGEYNTKASDIYAFGCLAYEVFAGKQPFTETFNRSLVMIKVLEGHRPKRPDNSPIWNTWGLTRTDDLWTMIEDGWKANPAERPAIESVIQTLERALAEGRRGLDDRSAQPEGKPGDA
ncbi:hypothetical protein H0H92_015863 [Tricholoma furcatifolium]|nr:hypothetical protein H0H92_015863 [Tricholoma furcatifolium]